MLYLDQHLSSPVDRHHVTMSSTFDERINCGHLFMVIARISSHPFFALHLILHVSQTRSLYDNFSRRGASFAILRTRHHFPSTTPYPASIYLQERKVKEWQERRGEWPFGRVVLVSRFLTRAAISSVHDLCSCRRT